MCHEKPFYQAGYFLIKLRPITFGKKLLFGCLDFLVVFFGDAAIVLVVREVGAKIDGTAGMSLKGFCRIASFHTSSRAAPQPFRKPRTTAISVSASGAIWRY